MRFLTVQAADFSALAGLLHKETAPVGTVVRAGTVTGAVRYHLPVRAGEFAS